MAYTFDSYDQSVVFNGLENGIAPDPYSGIADMRNINIRSVPKEGSVNLALFLKSGVSYQNIAISSADSSTNILTLSGGSAINSGQAITIAGTNLPGGITAGTTYWIGNLGAGQIKLYTDYALDTILTITSDGTPGNWTFSTIDMGKPTYFTQDGDWLVDKNGRVWGSGSLWRYTGNQVPSSATAGNGIVYYEANNGSTTVGYIFVFHNSSIDYTKTSTISWVYQWQPSSGTSLGYASIPTRTLKSDLITQTIHEAKTMPDNKVYYCDTNYIGRFYQVNSSTLFDPTNTSTYVFDQTQLLPTDDAAQCLAPSGNNVLVGGTKNVVYPWDTFSQVPAFPIFIAESNIVKMETVNTNTYILAGARGRIYITNGSQADLYAKIPDHISGTVEPYFIWGGFCANRNQLFFSFSSTDNNSNSLTTYGGVWAIDLDTQAIRLVNQLSFGTYAGLATALVAVTGSGAGLGYIAGWDNGSSGYGVDASYNQSSQSSPYTDSQASIDFDLLPIGTFEKPRQFTNVEYRLSKPMVSGESISLYYRKDFSQTWTLIKTFGWNDVNSGGDFSNFSPVNIDNAQWLQLRAVLNSTATSPSYVRLRELRIKGLIGPTLGTNELLSL